MKYEIAILLTGIVFTSLIRFVSAENKVITSRNVFRVGDRIEIFCLVENEQVNLSNIVVKQVYTTTDGTSKENVLIPTINTNSTVSINIPSASVNNGGTYGCYEVTSSNFTKDLTPLSQQTICVLEDVKKPLNFRCVLRDFKSLQCFWESNTTTYWQLKYRCVGCGNQNFSTCDDVNKHVISSNKGNIFQSCSLALTSRCNGSIYTSCSLLIGKDVYTDSDYVFRLTGCNAFSTEFWDYNVSVGDQIVKLSSVKNLTAVPSTRSVCLSWILPFSPNVVWNGMLCLVDYSFSGNSSHIKSHKLYLNSSISSKQTEYLLEGLMSYTNYTFSVSCRPRDSIYWSDNATVSNQTLPGVPLNGPCFIQGGYAYYNCSFSKAKCLALYWQTPDLYITQGEVKGYVFYVSSDKGSNVSQYITGERTSAYLDIEIDGSKQYKIYGSIVNSQGHSKSLTRLVIPARNKELDPEEVCIRYSNDDKQQMYNVSYQSHSGHKAYNSVTYFWCQGVANISEVVMCKSDLHWKHSNETSILVKPAPSTLLHFAVAFNRNNYSSGMIWKECRATTVLKETEQTGMPIDIVLGLVLGSMSALIVLSIFISCSKKLYDKFKNYNPTIDVPVIHPVKEEMKYSSISDSKSFITFDIKQNKAEFVPGPLKPIKNTTLTSTTTNIDSNYESGGGISNSCDASLSYNDYFKLDTSSKEDYFKLETSSNFEDYLKLDTSSKEEYFRLDTSSNFESLTVQSVSGTAANTDLTGSYCDGQRILCVETTYYTTSNETHIRSQTLACSSSEYGNSIQDYNKVTYTSSSGDTRNMYQSVT